MSAPLIAGRIYAESGWRAVCYSVPLQAAGKDTTTVVIKVLHVVQWGVTFEGRLWPIDENGKPVANLDGVHAPSQMSDDDLALEARNRLQAAADAIERGKIAAQPEGVAK